MSATIPTRRAILAGLATTPVFLASTLQADTLPARELGEAFAGLFEPGLSDEARAAFWTDRLSDNGKARWPLETFQRDVQRTADLTGGLTLLDVLQVTEGPRSQLSYQLRSKRLSVVKWLRVGTERDDPSRLFAAPDLPYPTIYDRDGPTGPISRTQLSDEIERRVRYAINHNDFSGAVQVTAPDGDTLWQGVSGQADQATGRAITLETPFHLGSSDKSFTALMIGKLIRDGRLRYETRLGDVLPGYPGPASARNCTVDQLLTHSAGLGGLFERSAYDPQTPFEAMAELFPAFATEQLAFEPGAQASYSNEGYVVLGAVLEAVTGQSWYDLLSDQVYDPAGMSLSAHFRRDEAQDRKAKGYTFPESDLFGFGPRVENDFTIGYRGNSCGGGYSTVGDMTRYLRALRAGVLMPAAQLTEFITPRTGGLFQYGRGFQVRSMAGRTLVGHGGGGARSGIDGDHAIVWETGWTLSILGNYDAPFTGELARDIGHWLAVQDG